MSVTTNHKPRKQLSDQLDRLDGIIDALADGLNQAVADAARDGARAAVKDILLEVLTDPSVVAIVRATVAPESVPARPSRLAILCRAVTSACAKVRNSVQAAIRRTRNRIETTVAAVHDKLTTVKDTIIQVAGAPTTRRIALVSLGVGTLAVATAVLSHTVATIVCGLASSATAVAFQIGLWIRSTTRRFQSS